MTTSAQPPITLFVANLEAATSFYLSALQPLGYRFISNLQHKTANSISPAVGIGPSNTPRVDLLLAQSELGTERSRNRKSPHVFFPAVSRLAVRDFYAAALNAGGRPVSPPEIKERGNRSFTATIEDIDGNKVDVCYSDAVEPDIPNAGRAKTKAVVAPPGNSSVPNWRERVADDRTPPEVQDTPKRREQTPETTPIEPVPTSRGRPSSVGSDKRAPATKSSSREGSTGKTVVGTLLGAAAGAAVVYAFTKETADSKAKEEKFDSRMEGRSRLRGEARERAYALAWREKAARSRRERGKPVDRDSGYYSGSSQRREQSPGLVRYQTNTYPLPRRRSSFDDRSRKASPSRSVRGADRAGTASPPYSNNAPPRRSTSLRHPPVSHVSVSNPPSELRRPSPPSSRQDLARQPPPRQDPPSPRGPRSSTSGRTIRYIPVSVSSKADESRPTYRMRRETPPPPAREPRHPDYYDDDESGDGLDNETVVPDDSISVVSDNAPSHKVPPRRKRPSGRERPSIPA